MGRNDILDKLPLSDVSSESLPVWTEWVIKESQLQALENILEEIGKLRKEIASDPWANGRNMDRTNTYIEALNHVIFLINSEIEALKK